MSKPRILAVVTVAVLTSPAWAEINVRKLDPLNAEKERLKAAGWMGTFGANLPQFDLPDKAKLQRTANQLVGWSTDYLPKEIAAQVSMEMKHEIAQVASEAFEQAVLEEQSIIKMGQTGPLRYKVGVVRYAGNIYPSGYHKVSFVGGLAPFVALIPAGRARSMEARITIQGMPAEAEIFFDGEPTTQRGDQRNYFTPSLEVGKIYEYEIVARWQERGKEVKRSRQVTLTGGDAVLVDFSNRKRWINCKWTRYTGSRKAAEACSVAYSPDRKTVLRLVEKGDGNSGSLIRLFDAETGKPWGPKLAVGLGPRVTALAVAPDGKTVAAAGNGQRYQKDRILVSVWDATTSERVGLYDATNRGEVFDLSFFQNGKYVLITGLPKERK